MTGRPTGRRGFTLIELLVVLAILAVLASLITAAVIRTRITQQNRTTEEHLKKLDTTFARQRTAVFDTARASAPPPVVMALAANDSDRAKTLWAYLKYRRAFPVTFQEAVTPITVTDPTTGTPVTLTELGPSKIYGDVAAGRYVLPPDVTGNRTNASPEVQAAACAYLFMTARAERGEVMSMDEGVGSLVGEVDVTYTPPAGPSQAFKVKVLKDTFGNPITFNRMLSAAVVPELNLAPFSKQGATFHDPLDPRGRLTSNNPTNPAWDGRPQQQNIDLTKLAYVAATGLPAPAANRNPFASLSWDKPCSDYWVGTFVSAGQDGKFGTGDDLYSYRAREGN
jgi:prepilin-type N-terminal cleavage/methylation domain-containing protein